MLNIGGFSFDEGNEVANNDELELEEQLSPLERIERHSVSDLVLHRLHLARDIAELYADLSEEDREGRLWPLTLTLKTDHEAVVRQSLVETVPPLVKEILRSIESKSLSEDALGKQAEEVFLARLLKDLLTDLLMDDNAQVRSGAQEAIMELLPWFSQTTAEQNIFPLLSLLAEHAEEDFRVEAGMMAKQVSSYFSSSFIDDNVIPVLKALANDKMFRVRKAVAFSLANVCSAISCQCATEQLLPTYLSLSKDEIWGVRKACVESITTLSRNITAEARSEYLVDAFEKLVEDQSRWVRNSAYQQLGPFIVSFHDPTLSEYDTHVTQKTKNVEHVPKSSSIPPQSLIRRFVEMVDVEGNPMADSDTVLYCAFSFPGVLLAVGTDGWPLLCPAYRSLCKDPKWKVRRTLSFSLHEMASIFGAKMCEEHLLSTFELFLEDLDQVKEGVVRHFSAFVGVLSPDTRSKYITNIEAITYESVNWRFRKFVAKQLSRLIKIYNEEEVKKSIMPVILHLCRDQVMKVRVAIQKHIGKVFKALANKMETTENKENNKNGQESSASDMDTSDDVKCSQLSDLALSFVGDILSFSNDQSCIERLMFVKMCGGLARHIDASHFRQFFLNPLLSLVDDPVPNVRFNLATVCAEILNERAEYEADRARIGQVLSALRSDSDRDVVSRSFFPPADPPHLCNDGYDATQDQEKEEMEEGQE